MKLSHLLGTVALMVAAPIGAKAQVVIDNGTVQLGINPAGNLITGGIGLTFLPSPVGDREALAPGCSCEGWGMGDLTTGSYGMAGEDFGFRGIVSSSVTASGTGTDAASTGSGAVSVTNVVDNELNVLLTQTFAPSASVNLYQLDIDMLNQGVGDIGNLIFRRAMDWDVPPTEFDEYVTLQGWPATALLSTSNDGFINGNINNRPGSIVTGVPVNDNFSNAGPDDHGAVFDFSFGTLAVDATRSFTIFYGAAASEADALIALGAVGAEVYSLGKPSNEGALETGEPNTFIFGFAGVGGTPVVPGGAVVPINQYSQVAEAFVNRGRGEVSARMADQGFVGAMAAAGLVSQEPDAGKRKLNFHLSAFGGAGDYNGTANNIAVDYTLRGVAVAVDTIIDSGVTGMENALVGAQLGLSDANADLGTGFGSLDARSVDLILYGRMWGTSNMFAEGMLNFGRVSYDQQRAGMMSVFESSPDGTSVGALLRFGVTQDLSKVEGTLNRLSWYGELSTNRTKVDASTETNNGISTSSFSDRQTHAGLGMRFETAKKSGDMTTFARLDAAALFEIGDNGYSATQTTAGGAVFTANADAVDGAALRLRGTLGMVRADNLTGAIEYSGTFGRGDFRDHRITARLKVEF